ncbi:MAG TPA: DUF542 domain-containing protein [bacterium]
MKTQKITKNMSINEIIKKFPQSIGVFNKFNLDSCCGGAESLENAAKKSEVDLAILIEAIDNAIETPREKGHNCARCGNSSDEILLIQCEIEKGSSFVCARCLPFYIHGGH